MAKRKVKRFVIDVNTFIALFLNKETSWLRQYVLKNKIEIFTDRNLINELSRVLDYRHLKNALPLDKHVYLDFVLLISTYIKSESFNVHSPDPEDDYLYDLALTAHAKLLVTGERALLSWAESPVETINLSQFKKLF